MSNANLDRIKARKLAAALRISGRIVAEGKARELALSALIAARGDRRPS